MTNNEALLEPFLGIEENLKEVRKIREKAGFKNVEYIFNEEQKKIHKVYDIVSNNSALNSRDEPFLIPSVNQDRLIVCLYCKWFPMEYDILDNGYFSTSPLYYTWNIAF